MVSFLHVILAVLPYVQAKDLPVFNNIIMLDDIDFMDGISQHEYILVNFYAPMCGHYRRMKSSYQKLADNLASKNSTIKLALFDINGNKHIPAAFDIKDLPDLKFFSNKVMMEYTGGQGYNDMLNWVQKREGQMVKQIPTKNLFNKIFSREDILLVLSDEVNSSKLNILEQVAKGQDFPTLLVTDETILEEFGIHKGDIALLKENFAAVFDQELSTKNLYEFVERNKLEKVSKLTHESLTLAFQYHKDIIIFHRFRTESQKYDLVMKDLAKSLPQDIHILYGDLEDNPRIAEYFGIKIEEVSITLILQEEDEQDLKFSIPYNTDISSMIKSINEAINEEAQPYFKSQQIPQENTENPVKTLVSINYHKFIEGSKPTIVQFYAPWCLICRELIEVWQQLGKKAQENGRYNVAQIDGMDNEIKGIIITEYPTIIFYPKGQKHFIKYTGKHTVEDIWKFMVEHEVALARSEL